MDASKSTICLSTYCCIALRDDKSPDIILLLLPLIVRSRTERHSRTDDLCLV